MDPHRHNVVKNVLTVVNVTVVKDLEDKPPAVLLEFVTTLMVDVPLVQIITLRLSVRRCSSAVVESTRAQKITVPGLL